MPNTYPYDSYPYDYDIGYGSTATVNFTWPPDAVVKKKKQTE